MPKKKKDQQIIHKRSGGVDAYGLYLDLVVYDTASKKLARQERFFIVNRMVCRYVRTVGYKRAAWKAKVYENGDEAVKWLSQYLTDLESSEWGVELVGKPYLVELTAADVEAIKKGETPYARFAGTVALDSTVGKVNDDWVPGSTAAKVKGGK